MAAPRLITIPISHYCEKARWALERADVEYVEERHLQFIHHFYCLRAGHNLTTPVLKFADGRAITQSAEIVAWADTQLPPDRQLYPAESASRIRAIERWLDLTLGPDSRGWIYGQLLDQPEVIETYGLTGIPDRERKVYRVIFTGFRPYLATRMTIEKTQPTVQAVMDVLDEVADRLADGRRYLTGDRFTAADLTFASLAAPLVVPRKYGTELPPLDFVKPALREQVERFREHPAGQFALRVVEDERPAPPWLAQAPEPAVA